MSFTIDGSGAYMVEYSQNDKEERVYGKIVVY